MRIARDHRSQAVSALKSGLSGLVAPSVVSISVLTIAIGICFSGSVSFGAEAPTAASTDPSSPVAPAKSDFSPGLSKTINEPNSHTDPSADPSLNGAQKSRGSAADPKNQVLSIKSGAPLNRKFTEDQITDAHIRAEAGSMSRYSAKLSFSYYGPPAGDLSNEKQPNPDGTIGNYNTAIGGSVGVRYRIDPTRTISFGTGLNVITPFQQLKRVDVRTPYVSFDKTYRLAAWQMRHSLGGSVVTTPEYLAVGEYGSLTYDGSLYRDIGHSRFSVGLDTSLGYFLFKRNYRAADSMAPRYNWGFFPTLKFRANDHFGIYSSIATNFYNPHATNDETVWQHRTISQRLGFEYSINRDIYIAPYFNFFPQELSINSTTINLNTVISIL